jgi:hypothetical protein
MLLGLLALLVAAAIACCAAGSAGPAAPRRESLRRERYLRDHTDRVNSLDVERLLADQLAPALVADVMRKADELGLAAPTLWQWSQRHGAGLLALAVRAGVGREAFERHLAEGTTPERRSLELFADLNSGPAQPVGRDLPLDDPLPASAARLERRELHRFGSLPPITEPGLWPYAS